MFIKSVSNTLQSYIFITTFHLETRNQKHRAFSSYLTKHQRDPISLPHWCDFLLAFPCKKSVRDFFVCYQTVSIVKSFGDRQRRFVLFIVCEDQRSLQTVEGQLEYKMMLQHRKLLPVCQPSCVPYFVVPYPQSCYDKTMQKHFQKVKK